MKRQVWLRPDQCDLVYSCLRFMQDKLNDGTIISDAHKVARRYTYRRIVEVLPYFEPEAEGKQP